MPAVAPPFYSRTKVPRALARTSALITALHEFIGDIFRGKFYDGLKSLKSLFRRRQLAFRGSLAWLAEARAFARFLARAASLHLDR